MLHPCLEGLKAGRWWLCPVFSLPGWGLWSYPKSVNASPAAMAKHDGDTSSQAWPQTQNPTNGLMVLK